FEAGRSYTAVLGSVAGGQLLSVKGAPEVLLSRCSHCERETGTEELRGEFLDTLRNTLKHLALDGLRVLAVAEKRYPEGHQLSLDSVQDLSFRGLIAFRDPVRKTAVQAIADLRRAGLRPLMVTGDHPSTAQAIAVESHLSVAPQVMTGAELAEL